MASGDISLTVPVTKSVSGLTLQCVLIDTAKIEVRFYDNQGATWFVEARDGTCVGFNIATQARLEPKVPSAYTNARNAFLGAGANNPAQRIKALVQQLTTDGLIVAVGTVA